MRFMVILKSEPEWEAGRMPTEAELTAMTRFNEELAQAGLLLSGEGLLPSSKGARVRFAGGRQTVIDGPFAEAKELIAGFWIWKVDSLADATAWAKRIPLAPDAETEVEIRQVAEAADFGAEFTPELREAEERLRVRGAENAER